MMSKVAGAPFLPLTEHDFDPTYFLEALPQCDFECPICFAVKDDMLECANCQQASCRECLTDFTTRSGNGNINQGKFECTICHKITIMNKPNKILADILQHLRFMCPDACKETFPFKDLYPHKVQGKCYKGYKRPIDPPRNAQSQMPAQSSSIIQSAPVQAMSQSMASGFGGGYADSRPPCPLVHLLQKDSKTLFTVNFMNQTTKVTRLRNQTSFPHNFQCVNGPKGQLFMVGGGDYQKDEETLYSLFEIQTQNDFNFVKRDQMKHPRHGHSACWFGDKFIVVTGSRKEKNQSQVKCEMYNSDIDLWFEMPDLNTGRHYHSSCGFSDKFVFVFCGIANQTRKYINSIEKYDTSNRNKWEMIQISQKLFADRQGAGVAQRDNKELLIFGGFSGKFLKDSFTFDVHSHNIVRTASCPNEVFLFQMPTVFDSQTNAVYSCDLQKQLVYKFDERANWSTHQNLKPNF